MEAMASRSQELSRVGNRPIRIFAIASGGGHWVQLLRLRPAWEGCDVAYATVHADCASQVAGARFFSFRDASRKNPGSFVIVAFQILRAVLSVRPDVVVTTGSAPALFAILYGRMIGARTLWIDSIANSERMSSSGFRARKLAHMCVTQWPELAAEPRPQYWGAVL
jgi:UDP-N-acetylglucosamine:LPS N-acetylglucosamine transferase